MYNISDENYTSSLLTLLSSRVFVCSFIVVAYFTSQEFLRDRSRYENTEKKEATTIEYNGIQNTRNDDDDDDDERAMNAKGILKKNHNSSNSN